MTQLNTKLNGDNYPSDPASGGGALKSQTFNSNGTWTKPAGVTSAIVEAWGGGGGAEGPAAAAYGGGGGGYIKAEVDVSAISSLAIVIGAGGAGTNTGSGTGGTGGQTTVDGTDISIAAGGGAGGSTSWPATGGTVSASGAAVTTLEELPGLRGSITISGGYRCGGGGSPRGGPSEIPLNAAGDDGHAPGGGGHSFDSTGTSGNGAAGRVVVTWVE